MQQADHLIFSHYVGTNFMCVEMGIVKENDSLMFYYAGNESINVFFCYTNKYKNFSNLVVTNKGRQLT